MTRKVIYYEKDKNGDDLFLMLLNEIELYIRVEVVSLDTAGTFIFKNNEKDKERAEKIVEATKLFIIVGLVLFWVKY